MLAYGNARITWHTFCLRCMPPKSQLTHLNSAASDVESSQAHSGRMFLQWLETNATFQIRGKTLKGWIKEERSNLATLLRVFDSILAIPFMFLLVLLLFTLTIVMYFFLATKYDCAMGNVDVPCGLPVLLYITIGSAVVIWPVTVFGILLFCSYRKKKKESKKIWDDWTHLVDPGKRLIVADRGFLGMVDDRAMEGDLLFNLVGCPESVVLREVRGRGHGNRDRGREGMKYVIVGKCYVHLAPTDQYEYFGPDRPHWYDTSQPQEVKERWLNAPRKWKLEEIELV